MHEVVSLSGAAYVCTSFPLFVLNYIKTFFRLCSPLAYICIGLFQYVRQMSDGFR